MTAASAPRRKRSMLTAVLAVFGVILVGFLIVVAMQPGAFRVARSATVVAPPETVFAQVNDFHKWEAWNPWGKIDPAMKQTYDGAPAGVGASYAWAGNSQVGAGRMSITESQPNDRIQIQLDFEKPMKSTCTAEFTFESAGDQTVVTWSMNGTNNFIAKAIGLFMNMDTMIGGNFEKGLADLKSIAEAEAPSAIVVTKGTVRPPVRIGQAMGIVIAREFDAPRERVWKTWTEPELVKQWWGPEGFTAPACTIDLREGGQYLYCMRSPEGQDFWSTGTYREIVPMEKIVCTDSFADEKGDRVPASHYGMEGEWPEELVVVATFEERGGKTKLTLRHLGIPGPMRDMCTEGWNGSLDKLATCLAKP